MFVSSYVLDVPSEVLGDVDGPFDVIRSFQYIVSDMGISHPCNDAPKPRIINN